MYIPKKVEPNIKFFQFGGKKEKPCVAVEIANEDYHICNEYSIGKKFWGNSKKGAYGKGLCQSKDDPYKPRRIGLLGEVAFGKIFGLPVDIEYKKFGDKQDFILNEQKINVKTATWNRGDCLLVYKKDGKLVPLTQDIYINCFIEEENREKEVATVILVGYILKKDIFKCQIIESYIGKNILNYKVLHNQTKFIMDLK